MRLKTCISVGVGAVALLLLIRSGIDLIGQLAGYSGRAPRILSDLKFILCGGWHLDAPYKDCPGPDAVTGFIYPPPAALYAHWVGAWGLQTGFVIQTIVSVVVLVPTLMAIHKLAPIQGRTARLSVLLGSIAIAPVSMTFSTGHLNFIMLASFVLPLVLMLNHRPVLAGAWLAFGFWLKLYAIIQLPLFVMDRRGWRVAAASVAALIITPIALLPWVPAQFYSDFFLMRLPPLQAITAPTSAQSLAPVLLDVLSPHKVFSNQFVDAIMPVWLHLFIQVVLLLGLALALLHQRALKGVAPLEPLALLLGASLLYAPLAWGYHFVLALPLVWLGLSRLLCEGCGWVRGALIFYAWGALLIPSWMNVPGPLQHSAWLYLPFITRYPVALIILMGVVVEYRRVEWRVLFADIRRDGFKTLPL